MTNGSNAVAAVQHLTRWRRSAKGRNRRGNRCRSKSAFPGAI